MYSSIASLNVMIERVDWVTLVIERVDWVTLVIERVDWVTLVRVFYFLIFQFLLSNILVRRIERKTTRPIHSPYNNSSHIGFRYHRGRSLFILRCICTHV